MEKKIVKKVKINNKTILIYFNDETIVSFSSNHFRYSVPQKGDKVSYELKNGKKVNVKLIKH